ncbi:Otogelin, partial [Phaethon lepturus]
DVKFQFLSHSACEWHYDVCTSPCFKTCRDPLGKNCQAVPKVEGCIPACPLNMLLDEITQRCVYFEDCIEPADDSTPLPPSIQTPAVSHVTSSTSLSVISKAVTSFPVPEAKGIETTLASKLQLTAATGKTEFSDVSFNTTLPTITSSPNISLQSTEMTSGKTTTAVSRTAKSSVSLSSPVYFSPLFPSTLIKPEGPATFTPSSFESVTEKTTAYLPQFSIPQRLGMPSYTPLVNLTGALEGTKISVGQSFTAVANVTVTSFSPVITTSSLLKLVSSATTKAAIVLTEQTTFSPTSTPPISLGKAVTEPPIEMVQHLTRTAEVPFTTTLGPKTTLQTQETPTETTLSFTTHKKETPKTTSHLEYTSSSYFPPYSLHSSSTTEKPITLSTKRPSMSVPTPASPASERESAQRTSVTGSLLTLLSGTETTLLTTQPDKSQVEMTAVSPMHTSHETITLYPRTTIAKSMLPTEKTSPVLTFSTLSTVIEQSSPASFTESLDSSQTLETTTASPESKSTSSSVLLSETTEIPIVVGSGPSTSTSKSGTERTAVLPKQVISTTAYSSTFLASTMLLAMAHSSAAASVSSVMSSTGQNFSTVSAASDKAEAVQTPSVSSPLMMSDHPNDTTAPSVSSFAYLSTKPLHGLITTFSDRLATAEVVSGATASAFMLPRETATLQTCTPITENECIKHICLDGQLIQVNKSQNCPYNTTQPSCGVLGFATQMNGDRCCPKWECACRCTIFSDLSIVTYDGNHLALFKEASYVVSQTQDETITIHVIDCKTSNSNSTSLCLAMLNLTYVSNEIIINRLSRKITVNSRFAWPTVRKYGYKVKDSGFKYAVETPTKIRIQWFHNTGVMIIEFNSTREPRALGLCGFCDRSLENDLMLPNRTVLSKSNAPSTFIDSWQVPDTLKYVGEDRHQETNCSVTDCSECLRMVLNQTFSSCHPYVPPELFCDIWVQDTEYIQNPCISLAAYVAMCNKFNICIEWRSSDYCPFPCSENFSYQACIAACEVADSCQNNEVASLDSDSCLVLTEGCVCTGGTILHRAHTAVCIPEEKCACTDSSGAPHAVGEVWKTSLNGCCMQKCVDSETIIPVEYNCSDIHNLDCQRFAEVALLVPGDETCCPQKICICNQSLCERLMPECNGLEKLVTYYNEESCCPNYICECDPAKCEPMEQMPSCQDDQTLVAAQVENTCCISYICACGACSDQIPKCQEGEVLIVDDNTTERCCPTYQCNCEIYRCPEFKCMLGMSLVEVWSPEKCCPFRTCECACETIPKPQCKLGQKLQIDEQFQNSTENICNCVKYKCVRDKVCLSNERGVLLPGQTIMEHSADGICHVSYCTNVIDPSTKYYQINVSSIDCAVKCKANQVYQPPKDLTNCCGSCKNLSCLYTFRNGTVSNFKPGTVWISNCIRYECTNTAIGPVLVSSSVGCPPFNETECVKVGGYVVPFLEGCCKTCK